MKIQLDYDTKTITLEDNVNVGEFFGKIEKILPDFKKWTLETKTVINWTNPVTIPYYPYQPYTPWGWTYVSSGDTTVSLKNTAEIQSGTYQLEVI